MKYTQSAIASDLLNQRDISWTVTPMSQVDTTKLTLGSVELLPERLCLQIQRNQFPGYIIFKFQKIFTRQAIQCRNAGKVLTIKQLAGDQ